MSVTKCPVCSSSSISIHSPYRIQQKGEDDLPSDYQLFVCSTCGIWFKDNLPSEESLKNHYENLVIVDRWSYDQRLPHECEIDNVISELPEASKVLDVGCWTGRLLTPHYPKLKIYGVEPNAAAADIAKHNGLCILASEVTEDLSSLGFFDCITMVDVFEHLREPMKILNHLISALSPGGKLLIVTGRTDCFPVIAAGSSYWYFSYSEHLVFLNRHFANWLQKKLPNVRVSFTPTHHFHFRHFNFKFRWARFLFEFLWLMCWRFLSPHSPFPKLALYKLAWFKRFDRLKEPLVCGIWKDHVLLEIKKKS